MSHHRSPAHRVNKKIKALHARRLRKTFSIQREQKAQRTDAN